MAMGEKGEGREFPGIRNGIGSRIGNIKVFSMYTTCICVYIADCVF